VNYNNKPRILFLCGREAAYPLNRFLIDSARTFARVEVIAEDGPGTSIVRRSLRVALAAVPQMLSGRYDLVMVGFFGHFLMLPVRLLNRRPVVFYPLISAYETLVEDRQNYRAGSIPARLAHWLDRRACRFADHLLLDTRANIDYFKQAYDLPASQFTRLFVGSDERLFFPRPGRSPADRTVVLFFGTYLPLHGIEVIVEAAAALRDRKDIVFRLLGRGIGYEGIARLVNRLDLQNIEFAEPVPLAELPEIIARADICLGGHFGASDKAGRVIAGKTFHALAMGKATIVGDGPANHELLTHGIDAWFVPAGDAEALARAIRQLAEDRDLRMRLGVNAVRTFKAQAGLDVRASQLQAILRKLV
jgi:glycosyltransferase involved in cell wall biosynthesis